MLETRCTATTVATAPIWGAARSGWVVALHMPRHMRVVLVQTGGGAQQQPDEGEERDWGDDAG